MAVLAASSTTLGRLTAMRNCPRVMAASFAAAIRSSRRKKVVSIAAKRVSCPNARNIAPAGQSSGITASPNSNENQMPCHR